MVQDALDTFEFGLQRLLDGLEAYIGHRALTAGNGWRRIACRRCVNGSWVR